MKNYYRFKDVSNHDIDNILSLTVKANNAMWHFQIAEIQDIGIKTYNNWEMAIDNKTKIVIIVNPTSVSLFRGNNCDLDCSQPSIYFIPSYILFKCQNAHIYYANGILVGYPQHGVTQSCTRAVQNTTSTHNPIA